MGQEGGGVGGGLKGHRKLALQRESVRPSEGRKPGVRESCGKQWGEYDKGVLPLRVGKKSTSGRGSSKSDWWDKAGNARVVHWRAEND